MRRSPRCWAAAWDSSSGPWPSLPAGSASARFTTIPPPTETPALPAGVGDVLAVLRSIAIVLDTSDAVVNNSASAVSYGLVRHGELVHAELRQLARQARRDGEIREVDLELSRGFGATTNAFMRARVAPLGALHILILAEDHTHAQRVEEVRRDFVANVSHELKTPVGGIALLAEAVLDARDDPEAVSRFAARIQVESTRLTRLVKEIVDLSRLQAADTLHEPELVDIPLVVAEAVDRVRVAAEARQIALEPVADERAFVFGDADLLATAVANLVSNAVNYSEPGTRVAVDGAAGGRHRGDHRLGPGPGHPDDRAGPHLRALLPGRRRTLALHRRHRPRPGHRQARLRHPRR